MELLFAGDPLVGVFVTLSIAFAFQASLATAIFVKRLPWKRFLIGYLLAACLVPFLGIGHHKGFDWRQLSVIPYLGPRIFIGCLIGTAPVALWLLILDLWRGGKPAQDADKA